MKFKGLVSSSANANHEIYCIEYNVNLLSVKFMLRGVATATD